MAAARALRLAALPAGVALGLVAEWAYLRRGPLELPPTAADWRLAGGDLATGLVLMSCGVVAWWKCSDSRIGVLLVAAGFAWFLSTLDDGSGVFAEIGAPFVTLYEAPLVHATLSYPRGRLPNRLSAGVVALAYASTLLAWLGVETASSLVLAVLVVAAAARNLGRASGPERRSRLTAMVASVALAALLVARSVAAATGAGTSVNHATTWAFDIVIAGIAIGLVADLLLARWTESTVTGLVVDLGEFPEQGTLRDRLAAALGDQSLAVGYWLPESASYVDDRGRPLALPERDSGRAVTLIGEGDERVAALVHDAAVIDDEQLVESVAAAARIAVSNVRLQAEVRRQVGELDASRRRIVEAGDAQRRQLERELRGGAQRRLARVEEMLQGIDAPTGGGAMLDETRRELTLARSELVEFARGVHPRTLTEGGLRAALADLVGRAPVPVELHASPERFDAAIEAAAYFVCSEALANVGKYARASRARIDMSRSDARVTVSIVDDGIGGATLEGGSGLRGLADRVEAMGGTLSVESPPGEGTRLLAELPLA